VGTEKRERQKANRAQKQQQLQQEASRRKTFRIIAIGVGAVAGVFLLAWIASNFVGSDNPTTPVPADSVVGDSLVPPVSDNVSITVETTPLDPATTVTGG
jgi:hypothetical protein